MRQYKKKTYAKTVKKTVHPRRRTDPKSTMHANNQKHGKQIDILSDHILIAAYPYSNDRANPLEKYAMKHGIGDENGLRVTGLKFTIVNRSDTDPALCDPPNVRIVFERCEFYCGGNTCMYLPRDVVFERCVFHTGAILQVGHTCKIVQSHVNSYSSLYFTGVQTDKGDCSDIRIMDSSVGVMNFRHCSMISMENVCQPSYDTERTDYMFGIGNMSVLLIEHNGTVELNKCRIGAMDVQASSITSMKLNDTDFGHMDIHKSIIDALTVKGCGQTGHAGVIRTYKTKLTTAPDFSGSVFPVHLFPTQCEGKWGEAQGKLTLYKKVWFVPGFSVKLPFRNRLISPHFDRRIPVIARLRVPAGTPRHLDTNCGKVRVAEATVDGFFTLDEKTHALVEFKRKFGSFRSYYDPAFKYANGRRLRPRKQFDLTDNTCASGIHGFLTPEEADGYDYY